MPSIRESNKHQPLRRGTAVITHELWDPYRCLSSIEAANPTLAQNINIPRMYFNLFLFFCSISVYISRQKIF